MALEDSMLMSAVAGNNHALSFNSVSSMEEL